jgi:hypothetical protein
VNRAIVGFYRDAENHWVAEVEPLGDVLFHVEFYRREQTR